MGSRTGTSTPDHHTRCYVSAKLDVPEVELELHIFCDTTEAPYGSVAYLRTEHQGQVELALVHARSRVSTKRQQSMPRPTGAQLAKLLHNELSLEIRNKFLWSNSTTVLAWLKSCGFKVFVGTRVTEKQEHTEGHCWRYIDSENNAADDITCGKTLLELSQPNRWCNVPDFLYLPPELWPESPADVLNEDPTELHKTKFCSLTLTDPGPPMPVASPMLPSSQPLRNFWKLPSDPWLLQLVSRSLHPAVCSHCHQKWMKRLHSSV